MNAHQLNLSNQEEQKYQQEILSLLPFVDDSLGQMQIQKESLHLLKSKFPEFGDCTVTNVYGDGADIEAYDPYLDQVRTFVINLSSESIHETF